MPHPCCGSRERVRRMRRFRVPWGRSMRDMFPYYFYRKDKGGLVEMQGESRCADLAGPAAVWTIVNSKDRRVLKPHAPPPPVLSSPGGRAWGHGLFLRRRDQLARAQKVWCYMQCGTMAG